jgi:hypothetical protein
MEILGYNNATIEELGVEEELATASANYAEAKMNVLKCKEGKASNFIYNCKAKTGKTLMDWQYLENRYDKEVTALTTMIKTLSSAKVDISLADKSIAEKQKAEAEAATEKTKKVTLYVYIGVGVVLVGLAIFLKLRKK